VILQAAAPDHYLPGRCCLFTPPPRTFARCETFMPPHFCGFWCRRVFDGRCVSRWYSLPVGGRSIYVVIFGFCQRLTERGLYALARRVYHTFPCILRRLTVWVLFSVIVRALLCLLRCILPPSLFTVAARRHYCSFVRRATTLFCAFSVDYSAFWPVLYCYLVYVIDYSVMTVHSSSARCSSVGSGCICR